MQHDVDLSRRKFLKFWGLMGLSLGALGLSSLGPTESMTHPHDAPEREPWLEAKKSKKKKASSKKQSAREGGSTTGQAIG